MHLFQTLSARQTLQKNRTVCRNLIQIWSTNLPKVKVWSQSSADNLRNTSVELTAAAATDDGHYGQTSIAGCSKQAAAESRQP
jgi:hypothetical protein